MNKNELRLNNLVLRLFDKRFFRVFEICNNAVSIGIGDKIEDVLRPSELLPIPLTAEVLEKCGLAEIKESPFWKNQDYTFYGTGRSGQCFPIAYKDEQYRQYFSCEDDFYSWFGYPIESLHQLQNLYFALTGTELDVKL